MKKYIICVLFIISDQPKIQAIRLVSNNKTINSSVFLSMNQLFQLGFLQEELNQYASLINNQWSNNESVRILIERTELSVQQSSRRSQELMRSKIIELFKNIGTNIEFTSNNFIILKDNNTSDKNDQENRTRLHLTHHTSKQHQSFFGTNKIYDKQNNPKPLARIHGARRTMNRLRKKRELQEKLDKQKLALERQKKLDSIDFIKHQIEELEPESKEILNQELIQS